ncbi:hypothetical protein BN1708_014487 [Verticillium longisporum]|uniref:tRNA (guanine(10)-N(2))-methyltransferase TRMT11 N-terminal domain-containing protein n=1 Tax=Verticillium longisporum TaxID=100787 RepID=A0A0G4LWJ0_VERLO|nr:hypothetical protein BN1708_014487 [Verticillium longisporum]
MDYLVRFSQFHESFRLAELKALAVVEGIDLKILEYSDDHPFCIIAVPSADAARALIRRAILIQSIHELWGYAPSGLYEDIHADVRARTEPLWSSYATCSFKGQGGQKSLKGNFAQYGLERLVGEFFTADLTNTPLVRRRWMDGIVCDPPYGVREGLKVLGCRDPEKTPNVIVAGENSPSYIAPKKPYSFLAMLDDILEFATQMLVDEGRLSFWMPTANDEDQELNAPTHPCLEIVSVCVQPFNRWSRRLITYRRMPDSQVDQEKLSLHKRAKHEGVTADELNPFRERYFKGFKKEEA